ncbi:NAD(P)H-binding protein [Nocardiopsis alkaliphila]|uniref:NAD(P)H-binding protein n=1 Tax=Nocardiopsis alkaliphila TaxID=225762 RepID=UPI0003450146|nr:NAD(P)H-binding protein [Nocardiopsis alkaliphila]
MKVAVFGASGHTGRFVVRELLERGLDPLPSGRDEAGLRAAHPELEVRRASVDDPESLDRALFGAQAVINCAGPFATTAAPMIEAALRTGISYVDVSAEIELVQDTFARFTDRAHHARISVIPAMAFFGGLGDLLTTTALGKRTAADEVHVAYGLSGWHPTPGTRVAGRVSRGRREGRRVRHEDGHLEYRDDAPPILEWPFPQPLGPRRVIGEFSMVDVVTIPSHVDVPRVTTYMTLEAAEEVADPHLPTATDDRRAESFLVDVLVRSKDEEEHVFVTGRDIYAVTAPLAVEAALRILSGRARVTGVASAGEAFDAPDFLRALSAHLTFGRTS